MSPIGMIQETRKKTEISDVVAAIVKKRYFFDVFPKIMKIPKQKSRLMKKRNHKNESFLVFF